MPREPAARGQGLRTILISTQIAMSVILVVGALLLVRTFVNVQAIDPGFNAGGIFSFRLASRPAKDRGAGVWPPVAGASCRR